MVREPLAFARTAQALAARKASCTLVGCWGTPGDLAWQGKPARNPWTVSGKWDPFTKVIFTVDRARVCQAVFDPLFDDALAVWVLLHLTKF